MRPLIASVLLVFAGCVADGDDGAAPTTTHAGSETTDGAAPPGEPPEEPDASTDDAAPTTTRVPPDGEPASDFTLALGEGGSFTLSEETKPVHLVFWAEWCPICSRELPVIDAVAGDYLDEVTFVAVAGRSDVEASRQRVGVWFSPDRLMWGYDDDLWSTYLVRGQPVSFLISSDGIIIDQWFGSIGEDAIRERLDALVAVG